MKRLLPLAPCLCLCISLSFFATAAGAQPNGITVDDEQAEFTGAWVKSSKQAPLFGKTYRHDNQQQGPCVARFAPQLIEAGEYEVRLIYVATANRSTRTHVTIDTVGGAKQATVNQRKDVMEHGVPRALGIYKFAPGTKTAVTVSNEGADGFVVVDAVQFIPVALATQERQGKLATGWTWTGPTNAEEPQAVSTPAEAARRLEKAATVALSALAKKTQSTVHPRPADDAPVRVATATPAEKIKGATYDVIVIGATGSGVACAVRAAREGCSVLLVQHNDHIGGMMTNGLMQWDALYGGPRAPLFSELLGKIEQHYITSFGKDSADHQVIRSTHEHYPISWVEPHVAEREYNRLVVAEKNITLLLSHYPMAVDRTGALLRSVTLCRYGKDERITVQGSTFVDATYEGDLFALAGVPYRVGREARDEYHEPYAGKVFVNIDHHAPQTVVTDGMNLRDYSSRQGTPDPNSPFTADGAVQAYNYRFCVTKDPANRILPASPPPGYDREEYVRFERKSIATNPGPNLKSHMNSPILPGENHAYPDAAWPEREKIIERHKNFALGLMWFLQNDESVPAARRADFRQWGLPRDEFPDHDHIPYEMYVREARRIVGRHVFTSQDNSPVSKGARTPVHADSVAITDWYMDSHSCTTDTRPGYPYDGKLILTEESRPAQVPYRSLLPQGVDNLLVPVCLGATHVAWGAIRLEPVWMQTGEAAGFAAALARKLHTPPALLDTDTLVRTLVKRGQLVTFFNDVKTGGEDEQVIAAQYFGTRGFFAGYDASLDAPLKPATAALWSDALTQIKAGTHDPQKLASAVATSEKDGTAPPADGRKRGAMLVEMWRALAGRD